ncbi:MAG: hypothetical protein ABI390_04305 [Daejeonella sp.]
MKEEKDYIRDIAEIRSMMERSSKFLMLSGWSGVMAGIYALAGVFIALYIFHFNPDEAVQANRNTEYLSGALLNIILLALVVLILALGTAIFLSSQKAQKRGEKLWSVTSRRLLMNMAVPLITGGVLILILISKGMIAFIAPLSLIFYGLALYNASKFTYEEIKYLGFIQIILGLISAYFVENGLLVWGFGFGVVHIIYGIYIHFKYEK